MEAVGDGEISLVTKVDLLVPAESYYELPLGIHVRSNSFAPVYLYLDYYDPNTAFRMLNSSVMFWPRPNFTELVMQLTNPNHTSYAIPEGTRLATMRYDADDGVQLVEVDT